jgi:hypothetical protein
LYCRGAIECLDSNNEHRVISRKVATCHYKLCSVMLFCLCVGTDILSSLRSHVPSNCSSCLVCVWLSPYGCVVFLSFYSTIIRMEMCFVTVGYIICQYFQIRNTILLEDYIFMYVTLTYISFYTLFLINNLCYYVARLPIWVCTYNHIQYQSQFVI